jgi:hypothetical protein
LFLLCPGLIGHRSSRNKPNILIQIFKERGSVSKLAVNIRKKEVNQCVIRLHLRCNQRAFFSFCRTMQTKQ